MSEGAAENEEPEALQSVLEDTAPAQEGDDATEADAAAAAQPEEEPPATAAEETVEAAPAAEEGEAPPPVEGEAEAEAPAEDAPTEGADGEVAQEASESATDPAEPTEDGVTEATGEGEEQTSAEESGEAAESKEEEIEQSVEKFSEEGGPLIEPITEDLPQEETPREEDDADVEHPDPSGTPPPAETIEIIHEEAEEEGMEDDVSLVEEQPVYDRQALMDKYKEALDLRNKIQTQNMQMQHKLAEYFRKKKTDERGQEMEKNVTDQEQRYLKYMSNLEELQNEESRLADNIQMQTDDAKTRCEEKQVKVESASTEFMTFKYDVAKTAVNSRSGKQIPLKTVEQLQQNEAKKEQEVIAVRLENIKLKNRLKKREQQLKAKEELAEGLHLIDFEQLKIENQTYNEKIEERNEEILKLRRKITTTVQVLTHLKEKLQFVQGENGEQRSKLRDIDVTVAQRRDILTKNKQVRDGLRSDNSKLKHKSGLLGNEPLLRDFEHRKDEGDDLRDKLAHLKETHVELNMNLNSVRLKIERARKMT